ncbi:MAG: methylenetetrahydrofolate reductase [Pseudolabrys sp.]|nr:methylenetetrahydrofolate reductase [Pseudolabrys sp.]
MSDSSAFTDPADRFARGYTIEATRPKPAEIAAVAAIVGRGRELYLSSVPTQALPDLAALAAETRRAGLEPVVHVGARRMTSKAELDDFLARLRGEGDVKTLLVIAGDVDQAGPYADALDVIRGGGLREAGFESIGISGYPEGHARIDQGKLDAALPAKLKAAADAGLGVHIVSQFSFEAAPIVAWLKRLREQGIAVPVRVGLAGPTSFKSLLRYAKLCGVNASMRGMASGAAAGLLGNVGPEKIVEELAANAAGLGAIAPHYFSFGGFENTARYAHDLALRMAPSHAMT